jgi:hypothetical protein
MVKIAAVAAKRQKQAEKPEARPGRASAARGRNQPPRAQRQVYLGGENDLTPEGRKPLKSSQFDSLRVRLFPLVEIGAE